MTHPAWNARRTAAAALLLVALVGPAAAKEASVNPVARFMEGVDVAPGVEHRLVILHPILAQAAPGRRAEDVALGGLSTPDLLAFGKMEKSATPHAEAVSFTVGPAALLTGDLLRTDTADFAVLRDVVVPGGKPVTTALVRVSREIPPDPKAAETTMLGPVLPSALRFLLLADAPAAEVREVCAKWADEVRLTGGRLSPADLASADSIKKRAADYRKSLAGLLKQPPMGGREVVGCAVLLDGAFASLETFADGKTFAAAWPRLLDGIATEASVKEAKDNLLDNDIADPADPDRFLADMKKRLLGVFGARPVEREIHDMGRNIDLALDGALARALVLGEDRVVHFVIVTDPAHRVDKKPPENIDPNAAARKMRQTEEEKRLIERRNGGSTPPPPEPPPPTPPK